jgi:hypothetical protein
MIFILLNLLPLNSVSSLGKRRKPQGPKSGDREDVVQQECFVSPDIQVQTRWCEMD